MGLAQELLEPPNPGQDHHSPKNMSLQHCSKAVEQVEICAFHQTENAEGRSMSPWSVSDYLLIKNERNLQVVIRVIGKLWEQLQSVSTR